MTGIVSYGGYIPAFRIDRKVIADAWDRRAIKGERSLANNDEDSITMAVEAGLNCLNKRNRDEIDGLYFSTTTAPYREKLSSAVIATAMDLERSAATTDFCNSLRSSTAALKAAFDSVSAGSCGHLLVTAADQRSAYPKSDEEQTLGDGAAALLVGKDNVVATFEGAFSITNEMMDVWRKPEDKYLKMWEGRFIQNEGYAAHTKEVIGAFLERYGLEPADISKVILPAPSERLCKTVAQSLGFDAQTQIQDILMSEVGHCGTAQPLLMLCHALETAKPGDLLLMAAYGDGADAFLFRATEKIKEKPMKYDVQTMLKNKIMLSSYGRFLSYKDIVEPQPGEPFRLMPSATVSWRERRSALRCHGSKCRNCGQIIFPIQRICQNCRSKDDFDEVRISDLEGEIFTFTLDNIAGRSDDPVVVQTVVELDKGIRFYGLMTDCDPAWVELGKRVGFTFRRFYEGAGYQNYFWKLKPIRKEGDI
jgi:3-hydroxy-3-methylglutaryl CoA synthase